MGGMAFGWDETIDCIQDVELKGAEDEPLCVAHKTSKLFVIAGVYVRDDGYVLRKRDDLHSYYPWPDAQQVATWQGSGSLPTPLPSYSVSVADYLFGYSLWLIILGSLVVAGLKRVATRRRQARDAAIPVSLGPPQLNTDADRFIAQTVQPMLTQGERLQHQAWALTEPGAVTHCYYVALTSQRLILFDSKPGAFKPVLEVTGQQEVPRADITEVKESSYELTFTLTEGRSFSFVVPSSEKHFSNQKAFVRDVPRLLSPQRMPGGVAVIG